MKKWIVVGLIAVGVMYHSTLLRVPLIFQSAEAALADFYDSTDQAEDMLMDPLILAGPRVVPLVLEEVTSSTMPHRRYAIHFLGRYPAAIPTLKTILADEYEVEYIRRDALASLFNVDPTLGQDLAKRYVSRGGVLGETATNIAAGHNPHWFERTYWQALTNVHH
uniref:hypothetical protein n=1 Tax=Thaumasiovibrio occultus TaxID=1891184 RepID=UPI000B35B986|nr:hypothetical protein [Thaumasiovibrio occultus]